MYLINPRGRSSCCSYAHRWCPFVQCLMATCVLVFATMSLPFVLITAVFVGVFGRAPPELLCRRSWSWSQRGAANRGFTSIRAKGLKFLLAPHRSTLVVAIWCDSAARAAVEPNSECLKHAMYVLLFEIGSSNLS